MREGLDQATCEMLAQTLAYLADKHEEIDPLSFVAYDYYKNLNFDLSVITIHT